MTRQRLYLARFSLNPLYIHTFASRDFYAPQIIPPPVSPQPLGGWTLRTTGFTYEGLKTRLDTGNLEEAQ